MKCIAQYPLKILGSNLHSSLDTASDLGPHLVPGDAVVVGAGEMGGGLAGDEVLGVGPGGEDGEEEDSQHPDTESLRQALTHDGGSEVWLE